MRKIVVPTDFSENAFNALRYAVELFKYEKSEFYLLHAYAEEVYSNEKDLSTDITEGLKEDVLQSSRDKLKKLLKEIKDLSPNPKHQSKVHGSNEDRSAGHGELTANLFREYAI